jgi:hypothetical protein
MVERREFTNKAKAEAFYDAIEADYEYVSMVSNSPRFGTYEVKFGQFAPAKSEMQMLGEMLDKEQREINVRHAEAVEGAAIRKVAELQAASLTKEDRGFFIAGFCGADIKSVNPRKAGKEAVFKAGKAAKHASAQAIRACTAQLFGRIQKEQVQSVIY